MSTATPKQSNREAFKQFDAPELTAEFPGFNKSIGGSSLAAILGVSPWESPYERWLKMTGKVQPTPDNPAMARGRRWEPIIAEMYQASHPDFEVTQENPVTLRPWFVRHPDYEFLTGQPDRMLQDQNGYLQAGLEIKTASWRTAQAWGEEGSDQVPQGYLLQSNWYAGLMRVDYWKLVVQFFTDDGQGTETPYRYREYAIRFDEELFDLCVNSAVDFWNNHVLTDTPPEMDRVGDTFIRYVKEAFPRNIEPLAEATPEEEEVMAAVMEAKRKADEAAELFEIQKAKAQAIIGDRDGITSERLGKITWKCSKDRETVDWRGIVAEVGCSEEIKAKYTTRKPGSRVFLLSSKNK